MKIAVLSYTSGKIDRGVETVVQELSKRWQKKHQVRVYSALSLGVNSLNCFSFKSLKEADKFGAEIIMPMNGGAQVLLTRLYCWFKGKKMVVSGQAGLGWCDGWNLLMRPNVFVALSNRNAKWAKKLYGLGVKVEVIPNGVDLTRFTMQGEKINLGLKKPVVLCVAADEKYKQVKATKLACKKLGVSFLWVGGEKKFQHQEMPKVFRSVDVFTLVSESSEAFGIVNLEALASGLPVVAIDDELRREILGEFGIYVKDVRGEEYVEKLRLALKQGKKRPSKWLEQFSWDRIANQYEGIFSQLLNRDKGLV